ncbi:interferon lambda receptor 1 isoform X1 [Ictalurus furcatus]|uniref:interferon lambda receptor 1 isoform X1 n=1 Tax=Ictalurus furcatus TaxID=66913 RepID=UPI002350A37B|nr:interferon lambda receptor 1 isoform X1 [Ictalurus furcatus]XP_053467903.1 interferon lambda receptor 1 isoform X1 [Ictalurus furcatus]
MDLDMWLLRALILLVWCSGFWCNNCSMTKVYFESRNFHSRLHWDEVKMPGREVRYSVKYQVYGEQLKLMTGCHNISERSCDLSSAMMDIRLKYYVKVMVDELCIGEFRNFIPSEQTSLEAPRLSGITTGSSFTITLTTPMGPQKHTIREISCWERCQDSGESPVNYIVTLTHPESEAGKVFQNTSGMITLSHLDKNTQYCGVALYEFTHPGVKRQSENTTFCVTLPAADKPWIPVIAVSVLVAFFLLITMSVILCQQHVKRKGNLPKALQNMLMQPTPNFNPDPKVEINAVKVYTESPWNTTKSELTLPKVLKETKTVNIEGYAPQDYQEKDWHCHSYTNDQAVPASNQSAESCTSYSMVVVGMEPQNREELSSCANDSGLGGSISPGLSSCTDDDLFQILPNAEPEEDLGMIEPDSTSELLVLPVSRGTNGKLQFSIAFHPVDSNVNHSSEIMPLVPKSTTVGERTLLLTDLVSMGDSDWTDNELSSDHRNNYLPNRVPQICSELPSSETISKVLLSDSTSNYRENWVPGILPDLLPNDTTCIVSDNKLNELAEPEEDVDESPSELEAIFLGGWMVHVQG